MSNFKRLCEITETEIDFSKVSNQTLCSLLKQTLSKKSQFIFGSSKRHKDYTESNGPSSHDDWNDHGESSNWPGPNGTRSHTDVAAGYTEHTDHDDHNDYSEETHKDNHYHEASYHTDSSGGHRDYSEKSHRDN